MPLYRVMCDTCAAEDDIFRTLAKIDELPACCGTAMHRKICAPMVITDIAPYQAMAVDVATGKAPIIGSRSQHRDYLKRNGYFEMGNEMPKERTQVNGEFNVRKELTEATREVLSKYTA